MPEAFSLHSFPRAILHIDGDSFFASCEVASNFALKGKPVVTGKERGIASSMSYEAKARGVTRGMRLSEIRKVCPDAIILPSDYETYSLYSKRMYEIVRRYTPEVEEYSIDECFADLTGLRRPLRMSYGAAARRIKQELDQELGMTFSVGLGPNKVLAKVGSKWKKPNGLTIIPIREAHVFLSQLPIEKIWGIGPNTSALLQKYGIRTAYDFARKEGDWVKEKLTKPFFEIWQELRGDFVYPLTLGEKHDYKSISKTKTFTPPSKEREFVFSQLSKNIENACIKAMRHKLKTREVAFFLKTQDFHYQGLELKLSNALSVPSEIVKNIRPYFEQIYRPNVLYRGTGIVLMKLETDICAQQDLFGEMTKVISLNQIYTQIDKVSQKYGKHALFLGSSFRAMTGPQHNNDRGDLSARKKNLFRGETARKRLSIPMLGEAN